MQPEGEYVWTERRFVTFLASPLWRSYLAGVSLVGSCEANVADNRHGGGQAWALSEMTPGAAVACQLINSLGLGDDERVRAVWSTYQRNFGSFGAAKRKAKDLNTR